MDKKVTVFTSTKITKDHDAVRTKLTLDYSDLTDSQIRMYADDSCIIKAQTMFRGKNHVPAEYTYKVPVPGTRSVQVREYTNEELMAEMIKRFGVDAAAKLVAAMPPPIVPDPPVWTEIDEDGEKVINITT